MPVTTVAGIVIPVLAACDGGTMSLKNQPSKNRRNARESVDNMNLDQFHHQTPVTVRFADLDVLGHVNNATYLTYVETARIRYVEDICGWHGRWSTLGMILARTEIDYKLPLAYGDRVVVHTRASRLGSKSFDLTYAVMREAATPAIAAAVKTVMVAYDYTNDRTIPVPDQWRERITAHETALE